MKSKKREIQIIVILLIIQTIIYIYVGTQKSYLHIDEAYSYGLTNYKQIEIQDNEDFYNNWHNKEYYEDYLSIQKEEEGNLKPVYENQKNDVHPPLYYLFLRIAMGFTKEHFSKWTGIGLNIIIYAFITIVMYLILKKILKEEKNTNKKAIILAFISSIILASLSNVVYIRMYSLLTLEILITAFLHIKLLENEKTNKTIEESKTKEKSTKTLIAIGITTLAGILTHYYYLFYIATLYIIFMKKYIKEKKKKELIQYTLTMIIAGITSLIIFPYSIKHMFFGYRGQGVISNLKNISEIIPSIIAQLHVLNYYAFNNLLYIIILIIIGILIYKKIAKKEKLKISKENKEILKTIYIPTIIFFIIATIASPWKVLRYIVPICGLAFILVIYYLYKLLQSISNEKISNILIGILLCITIISPIILKMEPELLYTDKKEIVQKLEGEYNLPTIYLFNSKNGGFLDDILLFSKIDESYIAKNINYSKEEIEKIIEGKDISKGIIIFINERENNEKIINNVKEYLNLKNAEKLKQLNGCDIYFLN